MGQAYILRGGARWLPLPDASVDLIVTSPPYFALRSYRDGDEHYAGQIGSEPTPQDFLEALWVCTAEWDRVLKPSGSIWVNLGDKYAGSGGHNNSGLGTGNLGADRMRSSTLSGGKKRALAAHMDGDKLREVASRRSAPDRYNQNSGGIPAKSLMGLPWRYAIGCIDRLGLILRAEVVWSKPNGLPESVTDRVRRSHEQWFHFTKQGRYFSAVDEIREPHSNLEHYQRYGTNHYGDRTEDFGQGDRAADRQSKCWTGDPHPLGKLPGSVWTIPSEPLLIPDWAKKKYGLPNHFAAFPTELPRRIILGWSPSGVCTVCGEGRRPVVERKALEWRESPTIGGRFQPGASRKPMSGTMLSPAEATITGYACACPTPDAPTRPAVVVDPFGGTGTTAMVAKALGRTGISVDLSADYCKLARWRIEESRHGAKAEDRTWRGAQGRMF